MPETSRKPANPPKGGDSAAAISSLSLPKPSLLQSYDSKIGFVRPGFRSEAAVLYCIVESIVEEELLLHSNKNARHKNSSNNNNSSSNSNIAGSNGKHAALADDAVAGESEEFLQRNASADGSLSSGQSVTSSADLSTSGSPAAYLVSPIEDIPMQFVTSDGSVSTMAPDQGNFIFANLLYSEQNDKYKLPIVNTDILVVEDSDLFQMKALAVMFGSGTLALSIFELAVLSFQRNALVRSFINKTLGKNALPIEPAKSDTVRSVEESEILTFSSLSAKDFHRYRQIQELDSLVKAKSKPLPNFTGLTKKNDGEDGSLLKRRYFRPLMSQTLSQILVYESMREPIVLKKYYAPSDELLYVLFWPTPDRRQSMKVFAPFDYILAKDKFAKVLPKKGKKPSKEDLTAAASLSNIAMSLKEWDGLQQDCVTLTPAGQGLVTVQQFRSNQIAWVTTHVAGYILGLRGKLISGVENPNKRTSNSSSRASSAKPSRSASGGGAPPAATTVGTSGSPLGSARPNDETAPVVESTEDVDIGDNDETAEEDGLEGDTTGKVSGNENPREEGGGNAAQVVATAAAATATADSSDAKNHVPASRRVSDVPVMSADGTFIMHCSDDTRISIVSVPKRQHISPAPLPLISIDEDNTMTNSALQNLDDLTSGLEGLEASLAAGQEGGGGGDEGGSNPPSQPGSARSTSNATNNNNSSSIAPPAITSTSGSTTSAMPEISTADSALQISTQSHPGSKVPSARPSPRAQNLEEHRGALKGKEKEKTNKGKPDGFGTVMMSFTFLNDLQVMAHSDSTISMSTFRKYDPKAISGESIGFEERRVYLAKGVVVRYIHQSSPFSMDIMTRDGNRVLRRNGSYFATLLREEQSSSSVKLPVGGSHSQSTLKASSSQDLLQMTGFYKALIDEAPRVWTSVIIYKDGRLEYHYDPYEMSTSDKFSRDDYRAANVNPREASMVCAHSILPKDNRKVYIDAETKAVISTYRDGRRVIAHANGSLEVDFPDTTRYVVHKSGAMVYITHSSLPTVEIDLDVDAVSREHSNGKQVPISKGGDRVRCRIGMPDGSALLIKYDTRITAQCNGSMKLVRLDRSTLMVKDNCDIIFRPGSSWDKRDEDLFAEECADIDFDPKDTSNHNKKDVKFSKSTKEETLRMASALESNSLNTGNDDDATLLTMDTSGKKGGGGGGSSVGKFDNNSLESNSKSRASTDARSRGGEGGINKIKPEKRTIKQKGVSELAQCNSMATIESYGVGSNNSASRIIHTNKDVFLNLEAKDTKYTYNPLKMVCVVEDYEHNKFEVNLLLNDPLKVAVALAGEVAGLKPQAVSEAPIDPRAFTIKRNGQVCELCSIDNVSALESLVSQHQDGIKSLQYAISQPSDLGAAQQHLFYMRVRNGVFDKLEFDDIFTPRLWSKVKRPATVEYVCKVNNGGGNSSDGQLSKGIVSKELCPRLYTFNMMLERLPLSTEGFLKLSEDVAKWEQFRTDRELSIHRFAIEDTRSAEDLEEEQRVKAKLKQVYKIAKKMEKAKREKEKEERARLQSISQSDPLKEPQVTIGKDGKVKVPVIAHTSLEMVVEEKNEEDAAFSFDGEEEEDEVAIARSLEIKDAFLTYSTPSDGAEFDESDIDNHTISKGDLPNAFLQLMHAVIKKDLLEDILVDLDLQNCDTFYFLEFKGIFMRLESALVEMEEKRKAAGKGGGASVSDLGSDSDGYDSDTLMRMDINPSISEAIPAGGDPSSTYRPPSPPRKATNKQQLQTATTTSAVAAAPPLDNFWKNTANGKSYTSNNPPSAEPLIHRPWNWDPNQPKELMNASSADMPRGNAVNAVRTAKK